MLLSENEDSIQILGNDQECIDKNKGQNLFEQKRQLVFNKINELNARREDILEKF